MAVAVARGRRIRVHIFLHCDSRRAVLSRMAAESSATAHGPKRGTDRDCNFVWAGALEQAGVEFQLALCAAGSDCRHLLWARMAWARTRSRTGSRTRARTKSRACWRVGVDPCDCRYL